MPYHNSVHGSDVTHSVHWILATDALKHLVVDDPLLLFTSIISAVIHDLGHDGRNNNFHVNSNSEVAVGSCYTSPLEHHHLVSAFGILARKDSVLSGCSLEDRKRVRRWMRELVLATDFGAHFDIISEWRTLIDMKSVTDAENPLKGDERILAIKMAMKTADLGYLTKGRELVLAWTQRVLEEFFAQGDKEKELGLPVSFGCDRETSHIPQSQLGFYNFMVQPLYEAMALVAPMEQQLASLEEMRQYWQTQAEAEKATAEKATAEKATAETVTAGATAEKATAENAAGEKATAEKATAEKATAEKATAEKATAEEVKNATVEKPTAEQATADQMKLAAGSGKEIA